VTGLGLPVHRARLGEQLAAACDAVVTRGTHAAADMRAATHVVMYTASVVMTTCSVAAAVLAASACTLANAYSLVPSLARESCQARRAAGSSL
jgi:hypothetical protein